MMKTQAPTHLNRSMCKMDIHKSATQWGYTQGLNSLSENVLELSINNKLSMSQRKKRPGVSWVALGRALPVSKAMRSFLPAQHW